MKIIDVMQQWNDDCNDSFQMLAGEYFFEQLEYDCSEIEALKATKSYLEKFTEADFAELIGGKDAWLEALRTIEILLGGENHN